MLLVAPTIEIGPKLFPDSFSLESLLAPPVLVSVVLLVDWLSTFDIDEIRSVTLFYVDLVGCFIDTLNLFLSIMV